jgi:3-phytase
MSRRADPAGPSSRSRLRPLAVLLLAGALTACERAADAPPQTAGVDEALPLVSYTLEPSVVTERVLRDSDDPAIWVHPTDPAQSIILGTDKGDTDGGLYVFDLQGRIDRARSVTPLQRMNNVDIEYGLPVRGQPVDIAVATERNRMMLRVFFLPDMRPIDAGGIPVFDGDLERAPMGVALYKRPADGAIFAIVGGKAGPSGTYLWQYRLEDDGNGVVRGVKVREFGEYSGTKEIEAIAVDNALGYIYYSDEQAGVRKYHADPDAGNQQLAILGETGFVDDHEGIAIYERDASTGYLLVSDQGGSRLQVFTREGQGGNPHAHQLLAVVPVSAADTDGIEVTSRSLGAAFPRGLLVMMSSDGTFHYYRWEDVEAAIESVAGARVAP